MSLREEVSKMADQVEKMYCVLTGDCQDAIAPEKGLVFKVQQHENFVMFWKKFGWAIFVSSLTIVPAVVTAIFLNVLHVKY